MVSTKFKLSFWSLLAANSKVGISIDSKMLVGVELLCVKLDSDTLNVNVEIDIESSMFVLGDMARSASSIGDVLGLGSGGV